MEKGLPGAVVWLPLGERFPSLRQQYYFCLAVIVPSCHAQAPERPAPAPAVEFNF